MKSGLDMSFKVIENGTIQKPEYGFLFVFYINGRIFSRFRDIQRQNGVTLKPWLGIVQGYSKWRSSRQIIYDLLLVCRCRYIALSCTIFE